jgi:NhaP-type Na+/H+ or K+/H+ antiporter
VVTDTTLFGLFGYLVYFADLQLAESTLLLSLTGGAFVGALLGSASGWLLQRYLSKR